MNQDDPETATVILSGTPRRIWHCSRGQILREYAQDDSLCGCKNVSQSCAHTFWEGEAPAEPARPGIAARQEPRPPVDRPPAKEKYSSHDSIQQRISKDVHVDLRAVGDLISAAAAAALRVRGVVEPVLRIQPAQATV